jgi:hypothetical protein
MIVIGSLLFGRQEVHLVLGRDRHHVGRVRLGPEVVERPEEVVEPPRGRDPEEALDGRVGLVEDPVRDAIGRRIVSPGSA